MRLLEYGCLHLFENQAVINCYGGQVSNSRSDGDFLLYIASHKYIDIETNNIIDCCEDLVQGGTRRG